MYLFYGECFTVGEQNVSPASYGSTWEAAYLDVCAARLSGFDSHFGSWPPPKYLEVTGTNKLTSGQSRRAQIPQAPFDKQHVD